MMDHLLIGPEDKTARLLELMQEDFETGLLLIDDGPLADAAADRIPVHRTEQTSYLDFSAEHLPSFNILHHVDDHDRFSRDFVALLDTFYPEGATTLTRQHSNYLIQNCLRLLLLKPGTLLDIPAIIQDPNYRAKFLRLCKDPVVLENWCTIAKWDTKEYQPTLEKISGLLMSPFIREVLCTDTTFDLSPERITIAKLDRAKIGDFNAFLVGTLLIRHSQGQVYIPDFGFYGRDYFASLLRQNRFILGVDFLAALPVKLQQAVLAIKDKTAYRTTLEDAERLLVYFRTITKPSQITDLEDEVLTLEGLHVPQIPPALGRLKAVRMRSLARHTHRLSTDSH